MRHLISPLDFTVEELDQLLETASDIEKNPTKYQDACKGKKIATLFYEPSTRTLSPLEAELDDASEKPKTWPPKLIIAASKLSRVLVLGS